MTLADLPRLPVTTKADLWEHYPLGLVIVPAEDVVCVHGSSGTGGRPTLVAYTAGDLALWANVMARSLSGAGATRRRWSTTPTGTGCSPAVWASTRERSALGATVVPMSGGMTARQIRILLQTCGPTC